MSSASNTRSQHSTVLRLAIAGLLAAGAGQASAASVTLCAAAYTQNLPGPKVPGPNGPVPTTVSVPMWGYSLGACGAATPTSPGPVVVVPPGDTTLTVTLQNNLSVPTSLVIAGQQLPAGGAPVRAADVVGPACAEPTTDVACRVRSFTSETAPGATGTYVFNNVKPGSYLYQSGTHQQVQVQMGLFGLAAKDGQAPGATQRQLTANAATVFDSDVAVVLSEIDPDQHTRIQSTLGSTVLTTQQSWQAGGNSTFDYNPKYFLVNGKPYDGAGATDLPMPTFNGSFVALRLANAGLKSRSLMLTKGHWQLLTEDGNEYPAPREQFTALLPAGKTTDARLFVTNVPATGSTRIGFFDRRGGTDNATSDALGGQVAQLVISSGGTAPTNIADLAISKTNGVTSLLQGAATTYTIVASNNGPNAVTAATVTDALPAALTNASWTCAASAGSACPASGTGSIAASVNLAIGGTATFTVNATVGATATGTLVNTATIAPPAGFTDRILTNNSATDSDTIISPVADLSITNTNGLTSVVGGSAVSYTVVVSNPAAAGTGAGQSNTSVVATVNDAVPAGLTGVSWTCTASAGSSCSAASGTGSISALPVTLAQGGTATFVVNGTAGAAPGTLASVATVTVPAGVSDPDALNNSATDSDIIVPNIGALDAFNRGNALNLGGSWSQASILGAAAIGISGNQAASAIGGTAYWNTTFAGTAREGAAFTVTNAAAASGASLLLKGSGTLLLSVPQNFIRVRATASQVIVESTTNRTGFTTRATFSVALAAGDRLSAVANTNGSVDVWKSSAGVTTYLGQSAAPGAPFNTTGTATRIGMQLPVGGTVDDFAGGVVTP